MLYSIIVPAFNEGRRLGASLRRIAEYVRLRNLNAEVVVVNDGSSDDTVAIAQGIAAEHPFIRIISNPGNRGKGYSVRNGMMNAGGDVLLFTDADLSSPIEEAEKLWAALREGADVAIGSRWLERQKQLKRQPLYRQFFGRTYNRVLQIVLGLRFRDTQCGFKAFTRTAALAIFPSQKIEGWAFDAELLYLAEKRGLTVAEIPVKWAHDARTSIRYFRAGATMLAEMSRVRWNDLAGRYPKLMPVPAKRNPYVSPETLPANKVAAR